MRYLAVILTVVMMLVAAPAAASVVLPLPTVTLPGVTITVPGPTVRLPGQTVTVPGAPVPVPGPTVTVTQNVPGPERTVTQTVPGPVSTADIPPVRETVTDTQTVPSGQGEADGATMVPETITVTQTDDPEVIETTVVEAATVSIGLVILGGLLLLLALALMYRFGLADGETRLARSLRGLFRR